ncbi:cytochrome c biogenesis FN [Tanacetum coccineum]
MCRHNDFCIKFRDLPTDQKYDRSSIVIGALRSPPRELRNELKYVQNEVKMNEISCMKVRHVEHKSRKQELSNITQSVKWVWVYKEPFVERASSIDEQRIDGALGIALFFSPFLSASSDPFVRNFFVRTEPLAESNPVPQDPISAIHPPCIYAGVVASALGFGLCRSKMMNGIVALHSPPMRKDDAEKNGRLFRSAGCVGSRRPLNSFVRFMLPRLHGGGTLVVLSVSTWSVIVSRSRFTSLEEERGGGGTEGPAKVTPLRVVITLRSSRGLGTM